MLYRQCSTVLYSTSRAVKYSTGSVVQCCATLPDPQNLQHCTAEGMCWESRRRYSVVEGMSKELGRTTYGEEACSGLLKPCGGVWSEGCFLPHGRFEEALWYSL